MVCQSYCVRLNIVNATCPHTQFAFSNAALLADEVHVSSILGRRGE